MPGIVGFACNKENTSLLEPCKIIKKMQEDITYKDFYLRDELFLREGFAATRSHINISQKQPQPFVKNGVFVWLDGELYNYDELKIYIKNREITEDPAIILELYFNDNKFSFLKEIDGIFSAVIYDSNIDKVYLISDRYGLRHLYWTVQKGILSWSSELKTLKNIPNFEFNINSQGMKEFIDWGYMFEDRTWFKEAKLLLPGTLLDFNIREGSYSQRTYWKWEDIKELEGNIEEEKLVTQLADLFNNSINQHIKKGGKTGLMLSGGLDSRLILASMPQLGYPINTVTFGKKNCDDVKFAKKAAQLRGAAHHVFEIDHTNWLQSRLKGIWWTDGFLSIEHMHALVAIPQMRELFEVNLNGFAGDAVIGGSFIDNPHFTPIKKFHNHVRRFTNVGTKLINIFLESRAPFYNNKFLELSMSISNKLKKGSYIYKKMLLKFFPEYYKDIPWQKTGVPITWNKKSTEIVKFLKRAKNKFIREARRIGVSFKRADDYTNYDEWVCKEPAKTHIGKILKNKNAIYSNYISQEEVLSVFDEQLKGKSLSEVLLRYVTIEIWFQQYYNNKLMSEFDYENS